MYISLTSCLNCRKEPEKRSRRSCLDMQWKRNHVTKQLHRFLSRSTLIGSNVACAMCIPTKLYENTASVALRETAKRNWTGAFLIQFVLEFSNNLHDIAD